MKYGDRVLLKEYKNGNKLWGIVSHCQKCNDTGKVIWSYADHVCFDCNGKGWWFSKEREYTPENLAKIEAKRAKEHAERDAERAKLEAERAEREAKWKAEKEEYERKRKGHFFGTVGQKIEMEVTYKGYSEFNTSFGWMSVYRFDTDDGAHMIWKSHACIGGQEWMVNEDDRITIRATIKDHRDYNGVDQTELTRVKILKASLKYNPDTDNYEPYEE